MAIMETLIEIPAALEANVFGKLDEHLKKIERALNVTMVARAVSYTHLTLPTNSLV